MCSKETLSKKVEKNTNGFWCTAKLRDMPYSNAEAIYIHTYKKLKTHIVTCFLYADWETYYALVFGKYTYLLVQWEIQ